MQIRKTITILLTAAVVLVAMMAIGAHPTAGRVIKRPTNYNFMVAYVLGQTLRFTVSNPNTPEQGSEPVSAHVWLYDAAGRIIAQSQEIAIAADHFYSFDFDRDAISAEGEPGTRRLQVRASIQVSFGDGSVRNLAQSLPISIEVIDKASGKTIGGPYFAGSITVSDD